MLDRTTTVKVEELTVKFDEVTGTSEETQAEILLNQMDIVAKQQEQDETLAEILLGQMEV